MDDFDLLIGATAISNGLILVTNNSKQSSIEVFNLNSFRIITKFSRGKFGAPPSPTRTNICRFIKTLMLSIYEENRIFIVRTLVQSSRL